LTQGQGVVSVAGQRYGSKRGAPLRKGKAMTYAAGRMLLAVLAMASLAAWVSADEPVDNLTTNPSFEAAANGHATPANWNGDAAVYARDVSVARTGKASLRYTNDDPKRYLLCGQSVPAQAGHRYRFCVWVKTKGVGGRGGGATVCLEWTDKAGKWMGGSYPNGIKGTRNWTRVEGTADVPENAGACTLTCYIRRGGTGTAWFDDVELTLADEQEPLMRTVLASPVYRGRITPAGPDSIRLLAHLNLAEHEVQAGDVRLEAELVDAAGNVIQKTTRPTVRDGKPVEMVLPVAGLPVGKYAATVKLLGPGDKVLAESSDEIVCIGDDVRPTAFIDEHRRLILDGKPFFPIGTYWGRITEDELKLYADSKFNCLMPYNRPTREQMDLAGNLGLKVIYSIKDYYYRTKWCPKSIRSVADEEPMVRQTVRQFRDHPALLAWYLNDELVKPFLPRLEAHQKWVTEEDPNHPTWVVLGEAGIADVADFLHTFDVIGTDPYPIDRRSAAMAAQWTMSTFRQVDGARPMWQVPQIFNFSAYERAEKHRTPTYAEKRSMAWQCICEGATGLVFYSWFDVKDRTYDVPFDTQWQDLKRMAAEIDVAAPVLLSVEPTPAVSVQCRPNAPRWLHWLVRSHGGKTVLFVVNNGDGEGQATFTLDREIKGVTVPAEKRTIQPKGKSFQDNFRKLDVRMYELK
jgi:hypothetical protein